MYRPSSLMAAALLITAPAQAQDKLAEIDRVFSWATPATPGCAVAVSHNGQVVNRAYGLADVERGVPLSPGSRFDIGSTQKQFVAAAILLLAEEGRLSLSDDVRKHVPELPDYGQRITLDHLLTHTSGLRDWTGLRLLAEGDPDVMTLIVRQRGLNFAPGEEWSYSNSGYVLLKEIVARTSGMSFAEFTRKRLFEPLGMKSTAYVPDALAGGENVALAYEKEGTGWKQDMMLGNARGGGALLSSAGDLLVWNDALTSGRLGEFVTEKLHEPARLNNGRKLNYARGLIVQPRLGGRVVWHSGGAAGYHTWLGRFPEHGLTLAVLCNSDAVGTTVLARRVVDTLLPAGETVETGTPIVVGEGAGMTELDLNDKAGLFFNEENGEPLRLIVNDGRLGVAGGGPLVPVAANRFRNARGNLFFQSQDEFELRFLSPDQLELRSMEGRTARYRRAQPYAPTAGELQALAGRYRSDVGSVFEMVPAEDGGLVMRFERSPDRALRFSPVHRDVFQLSRMTVRFQRDPAGKVVGFHYSNPVARNLQFTRLGDRTENASAAGQAAPPAAAAPTSPAPRLEELAGEYELAAGRTVSITLENGRLHGQPAGSAKLPLVHLEGATFAVGQAGGRTTVTFQLGADGRATAMVMRQNGNERILPRVR